MKKILFVLFAFLLFTVKIHSQEEPPASLSGDLGVFAPSGWEVKFTMSAYSIPFEGITNAHENFEPYNRLYNAQNGSLYRFFINQNTAIEYSNLPLIKYEGIAGSGAILDLAHVNGVEFPDGNVNDAYGFCKYLVEFEIIPTGEKYSFFYNTLDSKFGIRFEDSCDYLVGDMYFKYRQDLPLNKRLLIVKDLRCPFVGEVIIDTISTSDTLSNGLPSKEIKVWELRFGPNSQPLEKNFYARTTPFPVKPSSLNNHGLKDYIIGTTVIFDTVFKDLGELDRWGYNTDNSYYNGPDNDPGNSYSTPYAYFYHNDSLTWGIKITATDGDTMILKNNKKLFIMGHGLGSGLPPGDTLVLEHGSTVILENNAGLNTFNGGTLISSGGKINMSSGARVHAYRDTEMNIYGTEPTLINGGRMQIDSAATLRIGDNATLIFNGNGAHLDIHPDANLILGENSRIEFRNGAYMNANGITFEGLNNASWKGLVFHNAGGQTKIENCTFKNFKTAITIDNDSAYGGLDKVVKNNTFYFDNSNSQIIGVNAKNVFSMLVDNNTFNMNNNISYPHVGLFIQNSKNTGPAHDQSNAEFYDLVIHNNTFVNGKLQMVINNTASAHTPFNILKNKFYGTSNTQLVMFCRKISGSLKNNLVYNNSVQKPLSLYNCNVSLFGNTLKGSNVTIDLVSSGLSMAPTVSGGNLIWHAGKNSLLSTGNDNLYNGTYNSSLPHLSLGENCFEILDVNAYRHLNFSYIYNGALLQRQYNIRKNSWNNGGTPYTYLRTMDSTFLEPIFLPIFDCSTIPDYTAVTPEHIGFDVYDTVFTSSLPIGMEIADDQLSYDQAIEYYKYENYPSAITEFKFLINNFHQASELLELGLYGLYDCYAALDTSSDGNYIGSLWGNLADYLALILEDQEYPHELHDLAYQLLLMAETNMGNYYVALTGYEFLSMFHPDPEIRLLASWDYTDILNMTGGGQSFSKNAELSFAELKIERIKNLERKLAGDPITGILKRNYEKKFDEIIESRSDNKYTERELSQKSLNEKYEMVYSQEQKNVNNKAAYNLINSRNISRQERDMELLSDIQLISLGESVTGSINSHNNEQPSSYSLSQNYPNPFNPETNITFSLPVEGLVKLKVFDITGREIMTLVNDVRTAGSHTVSFNAANLSSGVYFYRLEAGSFIETKRMLLIK